MSAPAAIEFKGSTAIVFKESKFPFEPSLPPPSTPVNENLIIKTPI